jgi:hypothetical protein
MNSPRCRGRLRASSRCRTSGSVISCSSSSRVDASSHCRSSRNSASECSGRANAPKKRRNTNWKRFCASRSGSSGTGGRFPRMNSTSGIRLTISCPFGPTASRRAPRHSSEVSTGFQKQDLYQGSLAMPIHDMNSDSNGRSSMVWLLSPPHRGISEAQKCPARAEISRSCRPQRTRRSGKAT